MRPTSWGEWCSRMTRLGRGQNRRQKREWPPASAPTCRSSATSSAKVQRRSSAELKARCAPRISRSTVGHSFGKWQVAWVGFYSSDLNAPILGYQKQSQFAMGGLLGYDFGPVVLQGWLTSDVYEKNYGGKDVRGWVRVVLPLNVAGAPFGPSAPATMVRGSR